MTTCQNDDAVLPAQYQVVSVADKNAPNVLRAGRPGCAGNSASTRDHVCVCPASAMLKEILN